MQGEGLPKYENAPPPKRKRAAKQLSPADIMMQLDNLSLNERVAILTSLQSSINDQRKHLQEQIELINANVK